MAQGKAKDTLVQRAFGLEQLQQGLVAAVRGLQAAGTTCIAYAVIERGYSLCFQSTERIAETDKRINSVISTAKGRSQFFNIKKAVLNMCSKYNAVSTKGQLATIIGSAKSLEEAVDGLINQFSADGFTNVDLMRDWQKPGKDDADDKAAPKAERPVTIARAKPEAIVMRLVEGVEDEDAEELREMVLGKLAKAMPETERVFAAKTMISHIETLSDVNEVMAFVKEHGESLKEQAKEAKAKAAKAKAKADKGKQAEVHAEQRAA